jgi:uncharacterized MAPEG superfamily protein
MALSLWSLLGFSAWTLLLVVVGIGVPRIAAIRRREAAPKSFRADVPHGSERYQRTMRAHLNCVENLPVFAALVLIAAHLGLRHGVFEILAAAVLPARIGQTVSHVASGSNRAVLGRFVFFCVQLLCWAAMIVILALHAVAGRGPRP